MASGYTTTSSLADSLETVVAAAKVTREYEGVMSRLVDVQTLPEGTGLTYNEVTLGKVTAQPIGETTELNNYQQLSDSNFPLTPTMIGIAILITDRMKRRITPKVMGKTGQLGQNAIQRKKDQDGLTVLDGGTSLSGTGTTLVPGVISAASVRITSNTTEAGRLPIRCVLHGYQLKDIEDALTAGVGTYPIPEGETARVFKEGFRGRIHQAEIFEDGNITIDSSSDAKGGVFAKEGILLVQGKSPWTKDEPKPGLGGGSNIAYLYDEYVYGERLAANTTSAFVYEVYSNASVPTT